MSETSPRNPPATRLSRALGYLRDYLPSADDYRPLRRTWRGDLIGGVTVGVVALPLALAFGVSSGAGAASGLITAIVAGIVAGVLGGSNVQVSGPTGAMVVILGPIVATHGIGAMALLSLLAGIMVLVAGLLKLGRWVALIPWPVIEGFTVGIAIVIFLQQVPAALGEQPGPSLNTAVSAVEALLAADPAHVAMTLTMVAGVAAVMVAGMLIHPLVPGSLIAVVLATLIALWFGLDIPSIGELPSALPAPALPSFDPALTAALMGPAAAVAALAAIESLLSARVAASLADSGNFSPDRELFGQGAASIVAGLFGGMPATGAIARTAVNVRSGGRTRAATIVHALVLVAVVYLAAPIVSLIPLAALAGVLMVTAVRMVPWRAGRTIVRSTRGDAVIFIVTAAITVAFDLIFAVGIGIAVAAVLALRALAMAGGVQREALPGEAAAGDERIALYRLDGALFFGAADRMLDSVRSTEASVVILRMSQLRAIDTTGAQLIGELIEALQRRGRTVLLKGVRAQDAGLLKRVGATAALRHPNHLFDELDDAVAHARSHIARELAAEAGSGAGSETRS